MIDLDDGAGGPLVYPQSDGASGAANPPAPPEEPADDLEQSARARYSVSQVKDSMWEALDNIARSGATDQMRGYANEAMGKTKLTLGLATQSTHLTLTGLAQIAVGGFQKSIGEAKLAEDGKDILPGL
jgi:uncharacterized protein YjbJ (UPF0337 family)